MVSRILASIRRVASPDFWRAHIQAATYAGVAVVVFLVCLACNFPYGDLLSSSFSRFNLLFTYREQQASLPLGAILYNVRLANPFLLSAPPYLDGVTLRLSPAVGSLLLGRPGVDLAADLYGGGLYASIERQGPMLYVTISANGIDLSRYDGLARLGVKAAGTVSADGSALVSGDDWSNDNGTLRIGALGLEVRVARGLPAVRLGTVKGKVTIANGVVRIDSVNGSSSDMKFAVTGAIRLGPDASQSFVDLRLRINPTAVGRRRLAILLGMLPHPPGSQPYLIRGPLMAPSIT
jgi:type II secretion system protein N